MEAPFEADEKFGRRQFIKQDEVNSALCFIHQVSDGESPECITGVTLTVTYTASEQTVEGKEEKCVTCSSNGRILIAVCCIEGVLVALLVGHVVWNFGFRKDRVR